MLAGLSKKKTFRTPPDFCAVAGASGAADNRAMPASMAVRVSAIDPPPVSNVGAGRLYAAGYVRSAYRATEADASDNRLTLADSEVGARIILAMGAARKPFRQVEG
jgi:hypothetical protein